MAEKGIRERGSGRFESGEHGRNRGCGAGIGVLMSALDEFTDSGDYLLDG